MSFSKFEALAREAVHCRVCFEMGEVEPPRTDIDVAQPRWVGDDYWLAQPKVAIVMLNPGSGKSRTDKANKTGYDLIRAFRDCQGSLKDVLYHQAQDMPKWGKPPGRFASFYIDGLGLNLNSIAFVNVAWCATRGNCYPSTMLERCYERHTERLLEILNPDVVLLSGSDTHRFADRVKHLLPQVKVVPMFHYANRKSNDANERELIRVRCIIMEALRGR